MSKTIDIESMRDKLLTIDQVRERLEPTEHLSEYEFTTDGGDNVQFSFPDTWNIGLKEQDPLFVTEAEISVNGTARPLTKEAALEACVTIGKMPADFVVQTPGHFVQDVINYYANSSSKQLKLLASPDAALAFTRASISPFSNQQILTAVLDGIQETYNTDDVLFDYKMYNDLKSTSLRAIVPSHVRNIGSARAESGNDPWSVGIDISNSVTGRGSLELRGYLFAWWCTNGATTEHAASGKYRRRPSVDVGDAYDWSRVVVGDVLHELENELDGIEALTQIPLEGELNETLAGVFDRFNVPVRSRELVMANLVESDDLTAYGLMNAITGAANNIDDLSPQAISGLLNAGGNVAHVMSDRCETCHRFG